MRFNDFVLKKIQKQAFSENILKVESNPNAIFELNVI